MHPYDIREATGVDARAQLTLEGAGPDQVNPQLAAPLHQQRHRFDEVAETLLLHQATDRGDDGWSPLRRAVGEAWQVQPVVDPRDRVGGGSVRRPEELQVVVADGHDRCGLGELARQVRRLHRLVEDVFRVGGEAVRHAGQQRGEAGHRGRHRAEVRMQMGEPLGPDEPGQLQCLNRVHDRHGEQLGKAAGHGRQLGLRRGERQPHIGRPDAGVPQVGDRSLDLGQ